MDIKIKPSKLSGNVVIPPSKSFAHRALICAALSEGKSIVRNIELSDDIRATLEALEELGAKSKVGKTSKVENMSIEIEGIQIMNNDVHDINNNIHNMNNNMHIINCNESGSTLRFMIPIAAALGYKCRFEMSGNLGKRPLDVYYDIFDKNGIKYKRGENYLEIDGNLNAGEYDIPGNISSQFITGMLFALSMLEEDSLLKITDKIESKSYIDITLQCLKDFGIEIENNNYRKFRIKGNQKYKCRKEKQGYNKYTVEGDFSQGAFFLCADAIGNDVNIKGLRRDSIQGDKATIDILERMGCERIYNECNDIKMKVNSLNSTVIDATDCPDIIPVLSVCAAFANGTTEIVNAKRLRIKECDRLSAINEELSKLGANIEEREDSLIIYGNGNKKLKGGCEVWSHKDHRICMMLSIASTICEEEIVIKDAECISKSYPRFFEDFEKLGGCVEVIGGDLHE